MGDGGCRGRGRGVGSRVSLVLSMALGVRSSPAAASLAERSSPSRVCLCLCVSEKCCALRASVDQFGKLFSSGYIIGSVRKFSPGFSVRR